MYGSGNVGSESASAGATDIRQDSNKPYNCLSVRLTSRTMAAFPASPGLIEALVHAARRRVASQVGWREFFLALAIGILGLCALLLLGTRYVPFVLLPLVASLGIWLALQRWKSSVPEPYAIAQQIDARENLRDQVATAYYFRTAGGGVFSREIAASQYGQASKAAEGITPEFVFPDSAPWTRRASLWLLGVAVLFLGLRVALQPQLSLEPPLATLLWYTLFGSDPQAGTGEPPAAASMERQSPQAATLEDEGFPEKPSTEPATGTNPLPEEEYREPPGDSDALPEVEGLITLPPEESDIEGLLQDDPTESDPSADAKAGDQEVDHAPLDANENDWDRDSQSLLDKLKQAFENLLQTLDMASVENADSPGGREQGSGSSEQSASSGSPADDGRPDGNPASDAPGASMEGGESGAEIGETASVGSTSGQDTSGEESRSDDASAAGSGDGSKELSPAEQLEVLGTLAELYIKRAERMQGDVTIETRLAEQSASVPYNRRSTTHMDRGGTVSRDEIPAAYRIYIQNYFETIRKNVE